MKRHLAFGFLTILLITLNFAFIIVLVSEDVMINYDVLFLMWISVILSAAGLAYLEKTKASRKAGKAATASGNLAGQKKTSKGTEASSAVIYSDKVIKKFKLSLPPELTPKVQPGFFTGYITTEIHREENVQAVYTNDDQLLGFLNKKKKRLCQNLELLYKEPIICWGEINWDEDRKSYKVKGHVPILYNQREMNRFKNLMELKRKLLNYDHAPEHFDIFSYLEKAEKFSYLQQSVILIPSLDYEIDPDLLPELHKKLVEEEKWEQVLQLQEYPVLINSLPEPHKEALLQSLKKVQKNLAS